MNKRNGPRWLLGLLLACSLARAEREPTASLYPLDPGGVSEIARTSAEVGQSNVILAVLVVLVLALLLAQLWLPRMLVRMIERLEAAAREERAAFLRALEDLRDTHQEASNAMNERMARLEVVLIPSRKRGGDG